MSNDTLLVDRREPAILTFEIERLGYNVKHERLPAGDVESPTVIIEIKREKDFYRSIIDKRLFNQPKKINRTEKKGFIIIGRSIADERRSLKPIIGAITSLALYYSMTVLQVPNTEAAIAYAIHKIVEKEGKFYSPSDTHSRQFSPSLSHNIPLEMLMAVPGIGPKQASLILKSYPSMEKVLQASIADFISINGIGKKTATTLYESLR